MKVSVQKVEDSAASDASGEVVVTAAVLDGEQPVAATAEETDDSKADDGE